MANRSTYQYRAAGRGTESAAPPKKSIYEIRAEMTPVIDRFGKKDWSRYNATIPGAVWDVAKPLHIAYLPGLDSTQSPTARPAPYETISFAAPREYGPEEGWTRVRHGQKKRKQRRERRQQAIDYDEE
jgi:hypothetical protein